MYQTLGSLSPSGSGGESFERFLEAYPKRPNPSQVPWIRKQWDAISPSDDEVETMLDRIAEESRTDKWNRNDGQFIPSAENWLRTWRQTPRERPAARYAEKAQPVRYDPELMAAFRRTAERAGLSGEAARDAVEYMLAAHEELKRYNREAARR